MPRKIFALLTLLLFLPATLPALQDESSYRIQVDVDLVNVTATVMDRSGRVVTGLGPGDFYLYEDDIQQDIRHFRLDEDTPVSVGILLDVSGSMERRLGDAKEAVIRFSRHIHPEDDVFLVAFNDDAQLIQDFTDDREVFARAVHRLRARGDTSLYDALVLGLEKIQEGRHQKKAIVLITDGTDTSSQTSFRQALQAIRQSEVLVYPIGIEGDQSGGRGFGTIITRRPGSRGGLGGILGDILGTIIVPTIPPTGRRPTGPPGGRGIDTGVLEAFSQESGARAFFLNDPSDRDRFLYQATLQISNELRQQYNLGYISTNPEFDGGWRKIGVQTSDSRYRVRARSGYYARSSETSDTTDDR
ncbi:MAG: VWA domain-containing protein [Acidobacteria bacterium]|nr:VWA domain-containing protein [Acidobacteriota bacterium]